MAQPTVRPVPGSIQDGTIITVQGSTPPSSNGFSINLSCGPSAIGTVDVALHVNPRFNENSCPRNSFQNGSWAAEDRSGAGLPIQKGAFESIILVQNDKYMVSFNGKHFCEFKHRVPKERVTHVIVSGDLQVNNVTFAGPGAGAQMGASTQFGGGYAQPQQPGGYGQPAAPYGQPAAPYGQPAAGQPGQAQRHNIPGGMQPGRIIYINGTPAPNATKFAINLKSQEYGGDMYCHFNARFNERAVVKNSCLNGQWGAEERATAPFPFVPGTPFQMMCLTDPQEWKFAVNGAHFTELRHRNPNTQAVQWVEVDGDLTGVTINCP